MSSQSQPLYKRIYDSLRDQIRTGAFPPGARVPSEKELIEQFGVSRITSKRALEMLTKDGFIVRRPGRGSFVVGGAEPNGTRRAPAKAANAMAHCVGVVIPDFSESYGTSLLAGIEEECAANGRLPILRRSHGRQDLEEEAVHSLAQMGVGGVVVMPVHGEHYNPGILRHVLDGASMVFVDRYLKGISAPFVGTDNVAASRKATDFLLDLGHTKISLVSPPAVDTSTLEDRIEGFVRSHAERGVGIEQTLWSADLTSTIPGQGTEVHVAADVTKICSLVEAHPSITCFYAMEYNLALIVREALAQMHKRVPEDVSILCFDGPRNYIGRHAFTHVRQNESEMGRLAVRILMRQISGEVVRDRVFIEASLVVGASTGPVGRTK